MATRHRSGVVPVPCNAPRPCWRRWHAVLNPAVGGKRDLWIFVVWQSRFPEMGTSKDNEEGSEARMTRCPSGTTASGVRGPSKAHFSPRIVLLLRLVVSMPEQERQGRKNSEPRSPPRATDAADVHTRGNHAEMGFRQIAFHAAWALVLRHLRFHRAVQRERCRPDCQRIGQTIQCFRRRITAASHDED